MTVLRNEDTITIGLDKYQAIDLKCILATAIEAIKPRLNEPLSAVAELLIKEASELRAQLDEVV